MKQARPLKSGSVAARSLARDRILALMLEQVEAIRAHERGTRAGTDPEHLHKMRTAVRRLRAILGAVREHAQGNSVLLGQPPNERLKLPARVGY